MIRIVLPALVLAVAFAANPARAELKKEWIEYSQGDTKLKGYFVHDDQVTGKRPAVLMIHDRAGMTDTEIAKAEIWAKLGYPTFAADIYGYGQGVLPKTIPEMQAQTDIYNHNHPLMRARAQAGFDTLAKNPIVSPLVDASKIALIGYCFGGTVGVEFGSTGVPLTANVAIHGSFRDRDPDWAKNVKGMYLILHGADDMGYPLTTVNGVITDLRAAKVPFEVEIYSGTGHGFSNPKGPDEERANAESIATTARTLKQLFGI